MAVFAAGAGSAHCCLEVIELPGAGSGLELAYFNQKLVVDQLEERFQGAGYGTLKGEVAEVVISKLGPIRDRANELMSDPVELDSLLAQGADKAREVAEKTLATVYEKVGFIRAK